MKTNIIIATLLVLSTSCGNPHISSSRGGLERTNPPLTLEEEESACRSTSVEGYKFFFSNEKEPQELKVLAKCKSSVKEELISYPDGETFHVSNKGRETLSFDLSHKTEKEIVEDKILYLEDIFSDESFLMLLETPITHGNTSGSDRGVDSTSVSTTTKDSLVWSFASPITAFSVKGVSFESTSLRPARMRIFDCSKKLIKEVKVNYESGNGSGTINFLGFVTGNVDVCHVSLTAGTGEGSLAIDSFHYR